MKYLPTIAGILLGLLFVMSAAFILFHLGPIPPPMPGTPELAIKFNEVFMATGYMTFVKVFELLGGILVAIPRTRNLGLLVLGPIILNILFVNAFVMKWVGVPIPMVAIVVVIPLYLLWVERKTWAALLK